MSWKKRIIFTLISLVWGYISLDYLYYAFQLLADKKTDFLNIIEKPGLMQLIGFIMFLIWFAIIAVYGYLIKNAAVQIDLIEHDEKTGEEKIKRKWFDLLLQMGFLVTGILIRWLYLMLVLIPEMK